MTNKSELKSYNKHTWKYSPSVGIPELQAALRFRLKKTSSFFSLSISPSSLIRHLLFLSFTSSSNSFKTSPQLSKISSHGSCNSLLQLPLFCFFFSFSFSFPPIPPQLSPTLCPSHVPSGRHHSFISGAIRRVNIYI